MSVALIAQYRAEADHHARLTEKFSVAAVMSDADVVEEIRLHSRYRDLLRQQADALEANPAAWVCPKYLAWQY